MTRFSAEEAEIRTGGLALGAEGPALAKIRIGAESALIEEWAVVRLLILIGPVRVEPGAFSETGAMGGSTASVAPAKGVAMLLPFAILLVQIQIGLMDLLLQFGVAQSQRGTQSRRSVPAVLGCPRDENRVHFLLCHLQNGIELLD